MTYETLHGKLKIEQHEPRQKPGVYSDAPQWYASAPHEY